MRIGVGFRLLGAATIAAFVIACGEGEQATPTSPAAQPTLAPTATQVQAAPTATTAPQPTAPPATSTPRPAPTNTPSPTPVPGPQGKLTIGVDNVPPALFVPSRGGAGLEDNYYGWGVVQFLLTHNDKGDFDSSLSIAEKWELAADQKSVKFTIRKGVPFHSGGTVTAEDVVWSNNDAIKEGSTFWGVGNMRPLYERWEKLDDNTAVMHFKAFNPRWDFLLSDYGDHQPWVYSKKLVDSLGEEKANTTPDGTGPYKSLSWKSRERVELEAVSPHWAFKPKVKTVTVVEIPDDLARGAAFQTKEIDLAWIPNTLVKDLQGKVPGSRIQPVAGPGWIHQINFTGNFWNDKATEPRPGFKPDADHPWIGDPKNPQRMESARKVRLALSSAIDRQTLLNTVFAGIGTVGGSDVGLVPGDPQWKKEWEVKYDPEAAKKLIAEAGYPNGFTVELWNPSGNIMNPEAGDAIAQMWRQIGLKVNTNGSAYAALRPTFFNGQMSAVMMWANTWGAVDQPKGGAFGPTAVLWFELPVDIQQTYFDNLKEASIEKRIANNVKLQDYLMQWHLPAYFAAVKDNFMVGSRVKSWTPHYKVGRYLNNIWKLELQ